MLQLVAVIYLLRFLLSCPVSFQCRCKNKEVLCNVLYYENFPSDVGFIRYQLTNITFPTHQYHVSVLSKCDRSKENVRNR